MFLDKPTLCPGGVSGGSTVHFTDGAFMHDSRGLSISGVQRHGTCLKVTNSGGVSANNLHCYTHDTEVECGENCNELRLSNSSFGENEPLADEDQITILIDGDHDGTDGTGVNIVNSVLGQHVTRVLVVDSDQTRCSRISNSGIAVGSGGKNGTMLELRAGCVVFTANAAQTPGNVFVADGATYRVVYLDKNGGGSSYHMNDVLTVTSGTCSVYPQFIVQQTTGTGNAIKSGKQIVQGVCSVWGTNPLSTTCTSTGCTGSGGLLDTDGPVPASARVVNTIVPTADYYRETVPGTAFYGVGNDCAEPQSSAISRCNNTPALNYKGHAPASPICSGGPGSTIGNTTSETIVALCLIPGGLLTKSGCLEVAASWDFTNSLNAKTIKVYANSASTIGGTAYLNNGALTNSVAVGTRTRICNYGATNSQKSATALNGLAVLSASALPTSSVDTTQDWYLVFTGKKGLGTESLALEQFQILSQPY